MNNEYRLDSHKLHLHPQRVSDWLDGQEIYPIYLEISPSGICNHRCVFCSFDFMEYQNRFLDFNILKDRISELSDLGIKSIQYAGEGEPLFHKDIAQIVEYTVNVGIDVGISTNAVMLNEKLSQQLLLQCTWIKVSFNAAKKITYGKINGCDPADFDKVLRNLSYAAGYRNRQNYPCTLGIQMVVLPENESEIYQLTTLAKNIGMDYVVFKPYARNPHTESEKYKNLMGSNFLYWDQVKALSNPKFTVEIRENTFVKSLGNERPFHRCLALPFWTYIDAGGGVWGCYRHLKDERFYYGNMYESTFEAIWEGNLRRKSLEMMEDFDISQCGINCRMDEGNRYLWSLKNPGRHANFI